MALAVANPPDRLAADLEAIGRRARAAERVLSRLPAATRSAALSAAAAHIRAARATILAANRRDLAEHADLSGALRDRLLLDEARLEAMAAGIETVAALADPIGEVT